MSLVGSLEDLGLGDILQIITLSRKSGALCLRSDSGEGRVIFRDGLVCGARVKGRTPDLRGALVDGGVLAADDFDAACADAAERGAELSRVLADRLTPERFEGLRRECVEGAVLDMFGWETGEFSFEVGEDSPEDAFEVVLETGINAQYLAMEGTRRTDEGTREPEVAPDDVASFADVAEEIAADASGPADGSGASGPADAFEAVALTTVEKIDGATPHTEAAVEEAFEAALAPAGEAVASAAVEAPPAALGSGCLPPLVVLDADLAMLEWVKSTLEGTFPRIHIFQRAELAVARLRQYVARGDGPLILISPELPIDGGQGWSDVADLVARMKKQSPRSKVLWLGERSENGAADGALVRPPDPSATSLAGTDPRAAETLTNGLLSVMGGGPVPKVPEVEASPSSRLEEVRRKLSDPDTRGEVLNVVLSFASEQFQRVALFALRDEEAVGLAQVGLERAGGPGDEGLREVHLRVEESAWLSALVAQRTPVRGRAEGPGDTELVARLGELLPPQAWLGPVVSGGQVVAFLYGDNLPGGDPLAETEDLESALAAAGQALDLAVEQRARDAD